MSTLPPLYADEMLAGLCRWLRAAGHDCALARRGMPDSGVLEEVVRTGRLLMTRDRALARRATRRELPVLLLETQRLADQARELSARLGLAWWHRPMSRCLRCNEPLHPAPRAARARLPFPIREEQALMTCPSCARLYWHGGHVRRMLERLAEWHRAGAERAPLWQGNGEGG